MSDAYGDFSFDKSMVEGSGEDGPDYAYSGMGESILNATTILIVAVVLVIVYMVCCSDMPWAASARNQIGIPYYGSSGAMLIPDPDNGQSFHNGQSFNKILGFRNPFRKTFSAGGNGYPLH